MPEQEPWQPKVGEWVTYSPTGGRSEEGEVKSINYDTGLAFVLYSGDQTPKATRFADLSPGRPSSAWG